MSLLEALDQYEGEDPQSQVVFFLGFWDAHFLNSHIGLPHVGCSNCSPHPFPTKRSRSVALCIHVDVYMYAIYVYVYIKYCVYYTYVHIYICVHMLPRQNLHLQGSLCESPWKNIDPTLAFSSGLGTLPEPWEDPTSRNPGLQNAYSVDHRDLRESYFFGSVQGSGLR